MNQKPIKRSWQLYIVYETLAEYSTETFWFVMSDSILFIPVPIETLPTESSKVVLVLGRDVLWFKPWKWGQESKTWPLKTTHFYCQQIKIIIYLCHSKGYKSNDFGLLGFSTQFRLISVCCFPTLTGPKDQSLEVVPLFHWKVFCLVCWKLKVPSLTPFLPSSPRKGSWFWSLMSLYSLIYESLEFIPVWKRSVKLFTLSVAVEFRRNVVSEGVLFVTGHLWFV